MWYFCSLLKIHFTPLYSGGAGGPKNGTSGGGGCFLKYTGGKQYAVIDNEQSGAVIITLIGLPNEEPIPMTWYLVLSFICGIGLAAICGCLLAWVARCMDFLIPTDQIEQQRANQRLQQAAYEAAIRKIQYEQMLREAKAEQTRINEMNELTEKSQTQMSDDYYTEEENTVIEAYETIGDLSKKVKKSGRSDREPTYDTQLSMDSRKASEIRAAGRNFSRSPAASRGSEDDDDESLGDIYDRRTNKRAPSVLSSIASFIYGTGKRVHAQKSMIDEKNGIINLKKGEKSENFENGKHSKLGKGKNTGKGKIKADSKSRWVKPAKVNGRNKSKIASMWAIPEDPNRPRGLSLAESTSIPSIKDLIDSKFNYKEYALDGSDSDLSHVTMTPKVKKQAKKWNKAENSRKNKFGDGLSYFPGQNGGQHDSHNEKARTYTKNGKNVVKATEHRAGTPDSVKNLRTAVSQGQQPSFLQRMNIFKGASTMYRVVFLICRIQG